ncbi:Putative Mn2+ efflux pump MntP [Mariniphaga anaerophila]|uniref:Putative Mn2+ efflux pump MntP n=1 Tax=Mariniphaga anaerophila TaxID=1484053 RepID=A0A1M4XWE4_9BACT|nr:manganese efflux pump [Mariniphaga anaerophila]SHE97750.1 Putative Mn2+ efflux pump MntP [Mariniphaga anaerophila]
MSILTLILIAIAISLGILEISMSAGKALSRIRFWQAVKIAFILVLLQTPVFLIGWVSGNKFEDLIHSYDRWVPLALLSALGIKMIFESLRHFNNKGKIRSLSVTMLPGVFLAILIDALLVGISFAFFSQKLLLTLLVVGLLTFLATIAGILWGKAPQSKLSFHTKILGGFLLIGICVNLLLKLPPIN